MSKTSKAKKQNINQEKRTGTVNVGVDGNMLRLQFPSKVSKAVWGTRQKYKALGISNTPENLAKAKQIAAIAQMDILGDNLDVSLEKYTPFFLENTKQSIEQKIIDIYKLCSDFFDLKIKSGISPATQVNIKSFLRTIEQCKEKDSILDAIEIKNSIYAKRTAHGTKRILDFIYSAVEWGKRNKIIPSDTRNPYRELKKDVGVSEKYKKPQHILSSDDGIEDVRAYSPYEARMIVDKFACAGSPKGIYKDFVEFLFLTGCRTSEAIALRWEDISDDYSEILFRHSFCNFSKKIKKLKTESTGVLSRRFPCGDKLKNLLLRKNKERGIQDLKGFVFNRDGRPINRESFRGAWYGRSQKKRPRTPGVIDMLIEEGFLSNYLKPYSTRHSFITWQIAAGQTPANVAKLVGNSPETIYKHYVSADEGVRVLIEI
jgi:integrase